VPLFVTVMAVSAGHEHADCTVYGDKGAVMTVTVTQNCYCKSNCSTWFIEYQVSYPCSHQPFSWSRWTHPATHHQQFTAAPSHDPHPTLKILLTLSSVYWLGSSQ